MMLKYYAATAAATLALMVAGREVLMRENLIDNGLGLRAGESVSCDARSKFARTEDGTCNDQALPLMGAANVPLGRNVKAEAVVKPDRVNVLNPNPIAVSRELLGRATDAAGKPVVKPLPLNLLTTAWIQFQNHDWFDHNNTELDKSSYLKVPIPEKYKGQFRQDGIEEGLRKLANIDNFMLVPKTKEVGTRTDANGKSYPIFSNHVTHWWDGSQLYGSDVKTAHALRTFKGGKMTMDSRNLIPLSPEDEEPKNDAAGYRPGFLKGVDKTGFQENWWSGMSLLHNLFIRNHNTIAADKEFVKQVTAQLEASEEGKKLEKGSKEYDALLDQMLYDKARLVNTAIIAKIHSIDWTPAVFDTTPMDAALRANWFGILEGQLDKNVKGRAFWDQVKAFTGDKQIGEFARRQKLFGILGGVRDLGPNNVPFTITEEFTTVYRLHSLLPEDLDIYNPQTGAAEGSFPLKETRLEKSANVLNDKGLDRVLYSFGRTKPGQLVLNNFPRFLQEVEVPILGKLDMGAMDVLRDRERGVPRYNEFRRRIHLPEIVSFADLFTFDPEAKLRVAKDECSTLPTEIAALGQFASENLKKGVLNRIATTFLGMQSKTMNWWKEREGKLSNFDLKHCRVQKAYARFVAYRDLASRASTLNETEAKTLAALKAQVQSDIKEREEGLPPHAVETLAKIRALYNTPELKAAYPSPYLASLGVEDAVEALDTMVGTHAETSRNPSEPNMGYIGLGLGETQFQIFVLMASRRLLADRFFNVDYRPEVYTQRGMDLVSNANMKTVLVCNMKKDFPRIAAALKCVRSGFHPWNDLSKPAVCDPRLADREQRDRQMIAFYTQMCGS
jgi:hypothetical protein